MPLPTEAASPPVATSRHAASGDLASGDLASGDLASGGAADVASAGELRPWWLTRSARGFWLTRFVVLRLLGIVYLAAFACAARQYVPLVGKGGLLPAATFLARVRETLGTPDAYWKLPGLFWIDASDASFRAFAWLGIVLAIVVAAGFANALLLAVLWLLYLSFVQAGQLFYGYGWESLLLETGFLAIFLAPPLDPRPFPPASPPPEPVIWLLRWLAFRIMLGAGLIKLRGDPCWRELTCLVYHYETQPLPNPMSWLMNQLPPAIQKLSVLFNHYAELIAPFLMFGPPRARHVGGASIVIFQLLLIVSGNLSWLNWLTIVSALAAFDDCMLAPLFPAATRRRVQELHDEGAPSSKLRRATVYALATVIALLSINPTINLFSPHQRMNSSFDPLYLVNTYGAFGSIERVRNEIVVEGTADDTVGEPTRWLPYEFNCKPGDVFRRPCVVAPYQYRLDWQMWFAAMATYRENPWLVHFVYKLLEGEPETLSLIEKNPFPDRPPKFIRAELYRYEMTRLGDRSGAWWRRTRVGPYLPPLSVDDPELLEYLDRHGWLSP